MRRSQRTSDEVAHIEALVDPLHLGVRLDGKAEHGSSVSWKSVKRSASTVVESEEKKRTVAASPQRQVEVRVESACRNGMMSAIVPVGARV